MKRLEGYKIIFHVDLENKIEEAVEHFEDTGKAIKGVAINFTNLMAIFEPLELEETNLFGELTSDYKEYLKR